MTHKHTISDSSYVGPGQWYCIHTSAQKLNQKNFIDWLYIILDSIKCTICRDHALEYIKQNPIELYRDVKNDDGYIVGMFQWTWKFHNAVNSRLNKKILDYETAYNMYSEDNHTCSDMCGN